VDRARQKTDKRDVAAIFVMMGNLVRVQEPSFVQSIEVGAM
jgi:hypothetical protein